ncbi:MAG: DUF3426 domain-containing protein [Desulfobacteraceae bacterium]|nr:DUF3426 domain-containing protein [Desulfobacteraceae bacterium]
MHIICQECDTTFSLDEKLLKPSGSKVRCSQCGNVFVAKPPVTEPEPLQESVAPVTESKILERDKDSVVVSEEEAFSDMELEGIDLAELDAILDQDSSKEELETFCALDENAAVTESEFQEDVFDDSADDILSDLDFDFDLSGAIESDSPVLETSEEKSSAVLEKTALEAKQAGDAKKSVATNVLDEDIDFALEDEKNFEGKELTEQDLDSQDFELNDLDLTDLDFEEEPLESAAEEPETLTELDDTELSLDDLDLDLDVPDAVTLDDKEEDLELVLDEDQEIAAEIDAKAGDDYDLALDDIDLDDFFSEDEDKPLAESEELMDDSIEPEELTLDDSIDVEETSIEVEDELADLELDIAPTDKIDQVEESKFEGLELDFEGDQKPAVQEAEQDVAQKEDELDLSDIQEMLEGGANQHSVKDKESSLDMEPSLDEDLSLNGQTEEILQDLDDEIDLAEIEQAVDNAEFDFEDKTVEPDNEELSFDDELDLSKPGTQAESEELDFEFEMESGAGDELSIELDSETDVPAKDDDLELELESESAIAKSGEEDFDLSELGDLVDKGPQPKKNYIVDGGDIDLEFEIEEGGKVEPERRIEPSATFGKNISIEETMQAVPDAGKTFHRPVPMQKKQGLRKITLLLFVLIILAIGGYFGYDYINKSGIKIPYLSEYLNPVPKDITGTASLSTIDINSKFMDSEKTGRLFVITGKVKNEYSVKRGKIQVRGKLFSKGKVLVKTESSYAGVNLTEEEIVNKPFNEIKELLSEAPNPLDESKIAMPGQALDFIVVFSNLPEDLDEFSIELVRSQQIK